TLDSIQNEISSDNFGVSDWHGLLNALEHKGLSGQGVGKIPVQSWRRFYRLLSTMFRGESGGIFQDSLSSQEEKNRYIFLMKSAKFKAERLSSWILPKFPNNRNVSYSVMLFGLSIR
ncbi:MAG: hypothetical protein LBQ50_01130, partial [Planctomycetaceae bacterium]|nr:hypothetical protein [Planctomycetaceae bacterium]